MNEAKPTKDVRQAWVLGAVAAGLVLLFAFVVLPYVDPARAPEGKAPDFALSVIHGDDVGQRIRLSDLKGMVVVLDFWASWCGPCKKQMPILDRVAANYEKERVMVVGVNTDAELEQAREYLRAQPTSYPSVFDEQGSVSQAYGVSQLPTLVVVDAAGQVVYRDARLLSERSIRELIDTALTSGG